MDNDNHEERLKINAINGFDCAKKIMNVSKIVLALISGACSIASIYGLISGIKNKNIVTSLVSVILLLSTYFLNKLAINCHKHSKECQEMIEKINEELIEIKEKSK